MGSSSECAPPSMVTTGSLIGPDGVANILHEIHFTAKWNLDSALEIGQCFSNQHL
jgi:hypothetical protein